MQTETRRERLTAGARTLLYGAVMATGIWIFAEPELAAAGFALAAIEAQSRGRRRRACLTG
jgi:hypothetical protein